MASNGACAQEGRLRIPCNLSVRERKGVDGHQFAQRCVLVHLFHFKVVFYPSKCSAVKPDYNDMFRWG